MSKPCPFCDGERLRVQHGREAARVVCEGCGAAGPPVPAQKPGGDFSVNATAVLAHAQWAKRPDAALPLT